MIWDQLSRCAQYKGLSARFARAFAYLQGADLRAMPAGRYALEGDAVYMLVQDIALKPWQEGVWESHQRYADIQLVVDGEESLGVRDTRGLTETQPYDAGNDLLLYDGAAPGAALPMDSGTFAILFPHDAHRPCVLAGGRAVSRRVVVKVLLDEGESA